MLKAPFIVGVGRSGTTLLRLMLDAHPELAIPSETHFLAPMLDTPPRTQQDFFSMLTSVHTWSDFHLDVQNLMTKLPNDEDFVLADAVRVFYQAYAERFAKSRWGDKSPPYVKKISGLARLLPEARFIHIIRDGRDVAMSYRDKWFGPAGQGVAGAAIFWKQTILEARRQAEQVPVGCYLEVKFEQLVADPEMTLQKICRFIDLSWEPAMLNYHLSAECRLDEMGDRADGAGNVIVPKHQRLSIHLNTMKPPDPDQSGKWRTSMAADEVDTFNSIAADLLQVLGYDH